MITRFFYIGLFTALFVGCTYASAGLAYPRSRVICDASVPIEQCRITQEQCIGRIVNITTMNAWEDIEISIFQRTAFYSASNTYKFLWKRFGANETEIEVATLPQPQSGDNQILNFTINVQTKPGVSSVVGFGVMRVVFNATAGGGQVYYSCADVNLVITENFGLAVGYLTLVLLCLSIAGALITIITFTIFKSLRTFAIKLIMYLCVCIICGQSTFLAVSILSTQADRDQTLYGNHFCVVAGAMIHYFFLTNFFWCLCIAINLYLMVRRITHTYAHSNQSV
jgi:hypothetical protein